MTRTVRFGFRSHAIHVLRRHVAEGGQLLVETACGKTRERRLCIISEGEHRCPDCDRAERATLVSVCASPADNDAVPRMPRPFAKRGAVVHGRAVVVGRCGPAFSAVLHDSEEWR